MATMFQRRENWRMWSRQRKHYRPFMTTTPVLLVFFVTVVLCVALLQNIVSSGNPLDTHYGKGTGNRRLKREKEVDASLEDILTTTSQAITTHYFLANVSTLRLLKTTGQVTATHHFGTNASTSMLLKTTGQAIMTDYFWANISTST